MLIDKESQIKSLKENKEALEGKVKFLQETCRRAGKQIRRLENEVENLKLRDDSPWKTIND
jgi:chaperonin cofactor prefoldin|tara:strand:- start:1339 stop:1521 length:183 start_codon:yes stop_codon:yes gene_type:complete